MTQHNLDGIFSRIERGGKWVNVCLSDMTVEERDKVLDRLSMDGARRMIHHLCFCLRWIGEQKDLYGEWEESTDD